MKNDIIKDSNINNNNKIIISIKKAKYLGQVINDEGIPINGVKNINFDYIAGVLKKDGSLTKNAKI